MRVLLITDIQDNNRIKLQLRDFCEPTSILILNSIESAQDFINEHVVKFQLPLDLIIIYSTVNKRNANDFRNFIRNDYQRTYSKRDFNINEIPLVLIVENGMNKSAFFKYDLVIDDNGVENLNLLSKSFNGVIKNWRKRVLDELYNLGIIFNSGVIDYSFFFKKNNSFRSTRILSQNFKMFPRKLNYYWLDYDKRQIEKSIDDFTKMLKRSETIGKKGEERLYHKFFNKNHPFLLRDAYSRHWYEPRLYKNSTEFEEPDYTLKPNITFETDLSVFEVKLPNETFLTQSKFHTSPKSKLMRHIFQVNDYKDYLESDQYQNEINKIFGYVPKSIDYNILIGRKKDKEENIYYLTKRMKQMGQDKLNLMTYDDLLDYQLKFFHRMELLNVK